MSNVIKNAVYKARSDYMCDDCQRLISSGTKYHYYFGSAHSGEKPYALRICSDCKGL